MPNRLLFYKTARSLGSLDSGRPSEAFRVICLILSQIGCCSKVVTSALLLYSSMSTDLKQLYASLENDSNFNKKITIELSQSDSQISMIITDNGIGFKSFEKNIKDVLNPYFTTKKNGTGLGLSIVNKIVNDHNGKIEFLPIKEGAKIKIIFIK